MTVKEAKRYIKLLGLEKGHNVVEATRGATSIIEDEFLFQCTALAMVKGAENAFSDKSKAILFVYRYDGRTQIFFKNDNGIHSTIKISLDMVRKITATCAEEDYMMMVETRPHAFTVVSQM